MIEDPRDILEVDGDEEEELQHKQTSKDSIQRFIPMEIPRRVKDKLMNCFTSKVSQ